MGSAKVYRERKLSLYEGGIRVPYIVLWPAKVRAGVTDKKSIIHGVDWLPTLASICNIDLPQGTYDGVNVKNALSGKGVERKEPLYLKEGGAAAIVQDNWKGYLTVKGKFELYDVVDNPAETKDLKLLKPKLAERMEKQLNDWLSQL